VRLFLLFLCFTAGGRVLAHLFRCVAWLHNAAIGAPAMALSSMFALHGMASTPLTRRGDLVPLLIACVASCGCVCSYFPTIAKQRLALAMSHGIYLRLCFDLHSNNPGGDTTLAAALEHPQAQLAFVLLGAFRAIPLLRRIPRSAATAPLLCSVCVLILAVELYTISLVATRPDPAFWRLGIVEFVILAEGRLRIAAHRLHTRADLRARVQ
jgi:hypothetical protein